MRHLFECWPAIARRLRNAPSIAIFLDFDGTLTKIVPKPSLARLPVRTRRDLARIASRRKVQVCVISGRERTALRKLVSVPHVRYLGLYGLQNGHDGHLDPATREALKTARNAVVQCVRGLPGVWVEDKKLAFAVHYRGAPLESARAARRDVRAIVKPSRALRVVPAKMALDVVPACFPGKKEAVLVQLRELPKGLAIYAGDDYADESAFNAIPRGISIHVGARRNSNAQFRLRNPEEVRVFLEKLEQELS